MATTNSAEVASLLKAGLQTIFFEYLVQATPMWMEVALRVDSNKASEDYAWLGAVPKLRQFTDERQAKQLRQMGFSVANKTWESTISVRREAIEDDQYSQLRIRVRQMAQSHGEHMDNLVFGLLSAGFSGIGYDGLAFFSDSHVEGDSGTQSNIGTTALSAAAVKAAIAQMRRIKDDRGNPISVTPNLLVVPPELEWTARELVESTYFPDLISQTSGTGGTQKMAQNVLRGAFGVLVSAELSDADDWFLLDTTKVVKPLIAQIRMDPEFTAMEGESEAGFMRDEYLYGTRSRDNAAYGMWQYAFGASV